jgi:hypothetical protein
MFLTVMKSYVPKNRKNQGRPQKRLLDVVRSELVNSWPSDMTVNVKKGKM